MGLYTCAQYTPTPPRSLNYRRSGVQNWTTRKSTPSRSLNYHRSGVEDWTKREYKGQIPSLLPQSQLATCYVEAGAKLRESRGETLGEDVGKLGGSRDMENPNIADGDLVAHEVQVDLHMLRPLMLDGVGGEVHGADVVAVDERALGERAVELRQELS